MAGFGRKLGDEEPFGKLLLPPPLPLFPARSDQSQSCVGRPVGYWHGFVGADVTVAYGALRVWLVAAIGPVVRINPALRDGSLPVAAILCVASSNMAIDPARSSKVMIAFTSSHPLTVKPYSPYSVCLLVGGSEHT